MDNPNLDINTEDKQGWAERGLVQEEGFVEDVVPKLGLDIFMNPDKEEDKYAPDLIADGRLADLKVQTTPFFSAGRYGKDPGRTVTFNRKDLQRYQKRYPDLTVYYYVHWKQREPHFKPGSPVPPLHGVWRAGVEHIATLVRGGRAPEHSYEKRTDDTQGNAKSSYLLSLDDLELVSLLGE